jgi:uncharacterized protein
MTLREQLQADLKEAMKGGDETRKTVVRNLISALRESTENKRKDLVKKALKKHNVNRPSGNFGSEEAEQAAMAAYQQAMDTALSAENVEAESTLTDAEELSTVQRLVKQRQESIEQAQKAGRADLADIEASELVILEAYLPQQMSREEIEAEARTAIQQVGAQGPRDMGKVMSAMMPRVQGRADGKIISEVVKSLLS